MELSQKIKQKRKTERLSAEALAEKLGFKKANIYKWEKGSKPSDPEEFQKLMEWLDGKLENVPRDTQHKVLRDPDVEYIQEASISPDILTGKLLASMEREISRLQKDLDLSLGEMRHNILMTRAMQMTTQDLLVELLAKQSKKDPGLVGADVGIKNGENYLKLKEEGNFAYVGK